MNLKPKHNSWYKGFEFLLYYKDLRIFLSLLVSAFSSLSVTVCVRERDRERESHNSILTLGTAVEDLHKCDEGLCQPSACIALLTLSYVTLLRSQANKTLLTTQSNLYLQTELEHYSTGLLSFVKVGLKSQNIVFIFIHKIFLFKTVY